jgi:DNA helicase-2/ATP-dependent DNA helicase PcrA
MSYAGARAPGGRQRRPSRFLPGRDPADGSAAGATPGGRSAKKIVAARRGVSCRICGAALLGGAERKLGRCASCPSDLNEELFARLAEWRARTAAAARVPAYVVFTDATLTALAERQPDSVHGLIDIAGIGPRKLGMYGEAVLALVAGASVDSVSPA